MSGARALLLLAALFAADAAFAPLASAHGRRRRPPPEQEWNEDNPRPPEAAPAKPPPVRPAPKKPSPPIPDVTGVPVEQSHASAPPAGPRLESSGIGQAGVEGGPDDVTDAAEARAAAGERAYGSRPSGERRVELAEPEEGEAPSRGAVVAVLRAQDTATARLLVRPQHVAVPSAGAAGGGSLESRAWSQLKAGKFREALADAERAVAADPKSGPAYALRAMAKEALGGGRDALADLRRAAGIDPAFRVRLASAEQGGAIYDPKDPVLDSLLSAVAGERSGRRIPIGLLLGGAAAAGAALALWAIARLRRKPAGRVVLEPLAAGAPAPEGPRIGGKYELVRLIGRGGLGEVYQGIDHALGRPVAIKKLTAEASGLGEARRSFLLEAKTAAALHHPSIVTIYGVVEEAGEAYLVYELVRGTTLQALISGGRRLPLDRALEILRPVCRAVQFAHERGLAHRDVKPANIMIADQSQVVKITDFGTSPRGTPAYRAPECEQGKPRRESDVYALGVCLYEAIAGERPFGDEGPIMAKAGMHFDPAGTRVPGLPRGVDELLLLALQPTPELRLKSPAEFLSRLEAAAAAGATRERH